MRGPVSVGDTHAASAPRIQRVSAAVTAAGLRDFLQPMAAARGAAVGAWGRRLTAGRAVLSRQMRVRLPPTPPKVPSSRGQDAGLSSRRHEFESRRDRHFIGPWRNGSAARSERAGSGSIPGGPALMAGGAMVARAPVKGEVAGSSPARPACRSSSTAEQPFRKRQITGSTPGTGLLLGRHVG